MTIDVRRRALALMAVALLSACTRRDVAAPEVASAPSAARPQVAAITVTPWALPVDVAQQPDLALAPDGSLLLSWIEQQGDTQRLRFARWRGGRWSAPLAIAEGEGIGNAADTPHLRQTPDGALWATWLRRVGEGHARDVVLARSEDDGRHWSAPVAVNTDGTETEHGFASLWAEGRDALGIAWLDGRATAPNAHGHGGHAGHEAGGATMLRAATFDARLVRRDERVLDATTCDCCQTDVVQAGGPQLVYRARRGGEVRDIALLRRAGASWRAPQAVHDDRWSIDACPVNGPAIGADGRTLTVAWYTAPAGTPIVRVARSRDGASFGAPLDLATGATVLGRIDVAVDARGAWVGWLEEDGDAQRLRVALLAPGDARPSSVVDVAQFSGRGRGTGWPRLVASGGRVHAVWTDVTGGRPRLRAATLGADRR